MIEHFGDHSTHAGVFESVEKLQSAGAIAIPEPSQEQNQALAHESLDHAETAFGLFSRLLEDHLEELTHSWRVRKIDDYRVRDEIEEIYRLAVIGLNTTTGNDEIGITWGRAHEYLACRNAESFG